MRGDNRSSSNGNEMSNGKQKKRETAASYTLKQTKAELIDSAKTDMIDKQQSGGFGRCATTHLLRLSHKTGRPALTWHARQVRTSCQLQILL